MTKEEMDIVKMLGEVYNRFVALPDNEDARRDVEDFCYGIHVLQRHIMSRTARREHVL